MPIPLLTPAQQAAFMANEGDAKRLQERLESLRANSPERFPGVARFDVTGCCKLTPGTEKERTSIAVWAVKQENDPHYLEAQHSAFTQLNNAAPTIAATWLEPGRALAGNFADRKGHAMIFARCEDLETTIAMLETGQQLPAHRGLPELYVEKPNWVEIIKRMSLAGAALEGDSP